MVSSVQVKFVLLISLATLKTITCECRESFVTICDSFNDLKDNSKAKEYSDIIIGSEKSFPNEVVNLVDALPFTKFNKLTSLQVVQKISKLQSRYGSQCYYHLENFNLLSFYGNEFKDIEDYHFPSVVVKKFSLIKNKIETIQAGALVFNEVEILDLSENLLEDIVKRALPSRNTTKVITIKNNKLTHIEPGSFPTSLKTLNLDNNRLRFLESDVLDGLTILEELTLSNNKFSKIPDISKLKELIVFDISFNSISSIETRTFEQLSKLQFLDLSNNNLKDQNLFTLLLRPNRQPKLTISLALNHLRRVDLEDVSFKEETFILFGNPWDCTDWKNLSITLLNHQNWCDLKYFSSGSLPYCVDYRSGLSVLDRGWEEHIQRFHNTIRKGAKLNCELAPNKKFELLYPVTVSCSTYHIGGG